MTPRTRRQSSGLLPGVCCCAPSRKTSWKPATKRRIRSMQKPGQQIPALRRYTKVWPPSAATAICGGRWPRWDSIASKYECAQERNRLSDKLCPPGQEARSGYRAGDAAMEEIADWLEKLGMSEYIQPFTEHRIDVSVLRYLTDQDLKDIGIPLGHRRKILAAIGELTATARATPKFAAGTEPGTDAAERRQITVMFSDLVGSTTLSTRMDPEDLREVISAYQKCVTETVHRFDGFVARYMGDGALVYF